MSHFSARFCTAPCSKERRLNVMTAEELVLKNIHSKVSLTLKNLNTQNFLACEKEK